MSVPITYDPEDIVYLDETDGLRVHPRGTIHRAHCRSLNATWGHVPVLPWPKYADDDDRPCKVCKPHLDPMYPPASSEEVAE